MALTEADTLNIRSPVAASDGRRPRIWVVQYGPCWCRVAPGDTSSFDFVRFRSVDFSGPHRDVVVVSERVLVGSEQVLRQVHQTVPEPHLVVATGYCRATNDFWDGLPGGWVPVEELVPVDLRVEQCISGHPEILLARVLEELSSAPVKQHALEEGSDVRSVPDA